MKNHSRISLFLLISSIIFSGITSNPVGVVIAIALSWVYIQSLKVELDASKHRHEDIEELKSLIGKIDASIRNDVSKREENIIKSFDVRIQELGTKVNEVRLASSTAKVKEAGIKNKYRF